MGVHLSQLSSRSSRRTSLVPALYAALMLCSLTLAEADETTVRGSVALVDIGRLFTEPQTLEIDTGDCAQVAAVSISRGAHLACLDRRAPDAIRFLPLKPETEPLPALTLGSRVLHIAAADLDGDEIDDIVAITAADPRTLTLIRGSNNLQTTETLPLPETSATPPDILSARVERCDQIRRFVSLGFIEVDGGIRYSDLLLSSTSTRTGTVPVPIPYSISEFRVPGIHRPERRSFISVPSVCRGSISLEPAIINLAQHVGNRAELYALQAPEGFAWEFVLHGDFSGDGKLDVLGYAGRIGGWWLTSFASLAPTPRSISSLKATPRSKGMVIVGDFNADGRSDVLERQGRTIAISYARSQPLPGVEIFVDGSAVSRTDEAGHYQFTPPTRPFHLTAALHWKDGTVIREDRLIDSELILPHFVFTSAHLDGTGRGRYMQDGPALPGPYSCFGITAYRGVEGVSERLCPAAHYIAAIDDVSEAETKAAQPTPRATCCPLPAADWLTGEETSVTGECPPDSIAIGLQISFSAATYPLTLRCAKLNTQRVKRGPQTAGLYFGPRAIPNTVSTVSAPIALRAALGRVVLRSWDVDGCTAAPWGAPLTAVAGRHCSQLSFSELLSPDGRAVVMFPECVAAGSRFDPTEGCR